MSVLLLQTGGTDNLLLMDAGNLLLQSSGAGASIAANPLRGGGAAAMPLWGFIG